MRIANLCCIKLFLGGKSDDGYPKSDKFIPRLLKKRYMLKQTDRAGLNRARKLNGKVVREIKDERNGDC